MTARSHVADCDERAVSACPPRRGPVDGRCRARTPACPRRPCPACPTGSPTSTNRRASGYSTSMRTLGYRPNGAARALKSGRFHTIGVIMFTLVDARQHAHPRRHRHGGRERRLLGHAHPAARPHHGHGLRRLQPAERTGRRRRRSSSSRPTCSTRSTSRCRRACPSW